MKTVYSNDELVHIWRHAGQQTARNSNESMSFNGDSFYSYSTIIAKRINGVIIMSQRDYSVTTAKHKSLIAKAAGYKYLMCHNVNYSPAQNWEVTSGEIIALVNKQKRARTVDYIAQAERVLNNFKEYAEVVGYKCPADTVDDVIQLDATAVARALKAKKSAERKAKKEAKQFAAGIKWDEVDRAYNVARAAFHTRHARPYRRIMNALRDFNYNLQKYRIKAPKQYFTDFLRPVTGGVITSQGVNISMRDAAILDAAIKAGADIVGQKIGHYTIDAFNLEYLKAGCHTIPREEINYISKTLFGGVK